MSPTAPVERPAVSLSTQVTSVSVVGSTLVLDGEANVYAVDVSSLLTPDVHYVLDDHLTARGHELIADALIAAIR